jgi:cytochrome c
MVKTLVTCLFVSAGLLASAGNALAQEALAKKYNCLTCHAMDKKLVGPAYKDVAAKYRGDAGAEAKLVAKVKNGGSGVWGPIPMPPNSTVPDADVKALVKWVLSLK